MRSLLWWRRRRQEINGEAAARARREAERRLVETRRQWPEVRQARDVLSSWVEQGLRGGRA